MLHFSKFFTSCSLHPFFRPLPFVLILIIGLGCATAPSIEAPFTNSPNSKKGIHTNRSGKNLENFQTYRGRLVYGHEARTFTPCGTLGVLWLIDNTQGDVGTIYNALVSSPYQPIFVELHGALIKSSQDGFGAEYDGAIRMDKLVHASRIEESWECREKYHEFIFKAQGNEPGWTALIMKTGIRFSSINQEPIDFPSEDPKQIEDGRVYKSKTKNHSIELTIQENRCLDTMSDEIFGWKSKAIINGKTYIGCAKKGDILQ